MKSSSFTLMFLGCMTAGGAFAACSGETVSFPGGTGDGGSGGASSSTTSSGTAGETGGGPSSSSTTTSSSSGGGGGGDLCDQACAHAEKCSVPVCNFLPLDCADPRAECGAQCLLDATCEQIETLPTDNRDPQLVACVTACQQGGGGGGGTGGGGPSGRQCGICILQNSCLPDCGGDMACQGWQQCAQDCLQDDPAPTCFRDCDASFPEAAGAYGDAYECACTSCVDDCAAVADPCNPARAGAKGR